MTTFTIATKGPYTEGQEIHVRGCIGNDAYLSHWLGCKVVRVSPHELLVRVGGRALAFQEHEPGTWSWMEWTQREMDVGDEEQGRLV